ncbi:MAG: peroxiredoxin family protein [Dehalococcoidia bacterium]
MMSFLILGSLLAWLLIGLLAWVAFQLARQHGRVLLRLEELERQNTQQNLLTTLLGDASRATGFDAHGQHAESQPGSEHAGLAGLRSLADSRLLRTGLTVGTPAPSFRLPCLAGGDLALEDYRGHQVLLVFSDPNCGPCNNLAPQLEQLHRDATGLTVLMVSRGDAKANHAMVTEHGLSFPIGLQRQWETSKLYGIFATPVAYLIDEQGMIAARVAAGPEAVLALGRDWDVQGSEKECVCQRG